MLPKPLRGLLFLLMGVSFAVHAAQSGRITAAHARDHIGKRATVCGRVVSTRFADRSRGQPTFLDFDKPYRNQIFAIVIWGNQHARFGSPENRYRDKKICVTGNITEYRAVPEVIVSNPVQIQIDSERSLKSSIRSNLIPAGATAECRDGNYSFSQNRRGTCSHRRGVSGWFE